MKRFFLLTFILFLFVNVGCINAATITSLKKGVGDPTWPMQGGVCGTNTTCLQNYWNLVKELGIKWIYNWEGEESNYKPGWIMDDSVEFVPMISVAGSKTNRSYTDQELANMANFARLNPGSYWLIWNEPDLASQANLPADIAATIYDSIRNTIKGADYSAKLIVGNVAGWGWLNSFREAYKNIHGGNPPEVEGWSGHLYRNRSTYNLQGWRDDLYAYRNWMINIGESNKEFWLTEFGCLDDNEVGLQIMKDQLDWLEESAQSWITRYAWFYSGIYGSAGYMQGYLFTNSIRDLTVDFNTLGLEYASHPGSSPVFHDCPNYITNCIHIGDTCPAGKLYDRLGMCGSGFKCCNPWLTPTPTPSQSQTPPPTGSNPYSQILATSYSSQFGTQNSTCPDGTSHVGYIENSDYLVFNNLNFDTTGAASFQARVASQSNGGTIDIRLDSLTGTQIGTCTVGTTNDWCGWTTVTCNVSAYAGTHNLYLKFVGSAGYLFNLNWFKFTKKTTDTIAPAVPANVKVQ